MTLKEIFWPWGQLKALRSENASFTRQIETLKKQSRLDVGANQGMAPILRQTEIRCQQLQAENQQLREQVLSNGMMPAADSVPLLIPIKKPRKQKALT